MTYPISPLVGQTVLYVIKNEQEQRIAIEAQVIASSHHSPIIDVLVTQKGEEPFTAYLIRADHTDNPQLGTWHYPPAKDGT